MVNSNISFVPIESVSDYDLFIIFSNTSNLVYTDVPIAVNISDITAIRTFYFAHRIVFCIQLHAEIIGFVAACCSYKHKTASLTFVLLPEYQHKGYMSYSLFWFQSYLFQQLGIYRIEAQVYVCNYSSIKLIESLGYVREGRLRKNFLIQSVLQDSYMYSLLQSNIEKGLRCND